MASSLLFRGPAAFAPATRWPVAGALFAGLGIVLAAVAMGGAGYLGCLAGLGLLDDANLEAAARRQDSYEMIACQFAGLGGQQGMFAALTLFAAGFYAASRREALLLAAPPGTAIYLKAFALMIAGVAAYTLAVWFASPADLARDLNSLMPIIRFDPPWAALLAIGIGAPLSEELLFRGFLLPALSRSRLGFAGAALVTTAAWAALHFTYSIFGLAEVFLIGLYFSWLVWRTGSLWVPMFCHAAYNTIVLLILRHAPLPF